MWLPDTNVLIAYFGKDSEVIDLVEKWITDDALKLSCIVYAEFMIKAGDEEGKRLRELRGRLGLVYLDEAILDESIRIRSLLLGKKKRVLLLDCFIAATALVNNWIFVTRDASDFKLIPELKSEVV